MQRAVDSLGHLQKVVPSPRVTIANVDSLEQTTCDFGAIVDGQLHKLIEMFFSCGSHICFSLAL